MVEKYNESRNEPLQYIFGNLAMQYRRVQQKKERSSRLERVTIFGKGSNFQSLFLRKAFQKPLEFNDTN